MDAALFSTAAASLGSLMRLDAVTNNLANASTPAYKAQRYSSTALAVDQSAAVPMRDVATDITRGTVVTDFSQGPFERTGSPLDVALDGDGFLVLRGAGGERLTRRGDFGLDEQGYLVSKDGLRVQGDGGDLRLAGAGGGPVQIGRDGTIQLGTGVPGDVRNQTVGRLRVVTVADPLQLTREAANFVPGGQVLRDATAGSVNIVQGGVEGSNAPVVQGLTELIETMRGFETYQKAQQRLDQVTGQAIREVGRL